MIRSALLLCALTAAGQDWKAVEEETLRHFQTLVRFDTSDPPGRERPATEYLKKVLEAEGIAVKLFAVNPDRPNLVARLRGSGKKRPLLIMGHTDTVNVDPKKWSHPPYGAVREGGYIYGRGTLDDKDNVTAALMSLLLLKRSGATLERDVIFLAESGEEGHTRVGIQYMAGAHFPEIEAEYCLAEGWGGLRQGGQLKYVGVATTEKIPYRATLIARGPAGHGSKPLLTNALVHLSGAITKVAAYRPPLRLNDTTRAYFERLANISTPEEAARYHALVDPARTDAAQDYLQAHEPGHYSMLRTSISPTIIHGGIRNNVIPSEAEAALDIRLAPGEDGPAFLETLRKLINDPQIELVRAVADIRPAGAPSPLNNEAFRVIEAAGRAIYPGVPTLPTMMTGATDMANLRAKGVQCYGIGPAVDDEDTAKGFGPHSDQERILESELHKFVRYHYEIVKNLAQ
ncbi:MAG TPA: M20/M25/M40 family metallo-hydrolase [Bryobacteraceae bacterium]|nr:M20/M25/M40 family metallo-hydrolase [Bryobacteraceae bacterium]